MTRYGPYGARLGVLVSAQVVECAVAHGRAGVGAHAGQCVSDE